MNYYYRQVAGVFLAGLSLSAFSEEPLLTQIAKQLHAARESETRVGVSNQCPKNTKRLIGVRKTDVEQSLRKPDYIETIDSEKQTHVDSWSYFFAKLNPSLRGGGFPELTFNFSTDKRVQAVECHYAR